MSYSDVLGHRSMLLDHTRNSAYARALEKVIGPETTVMDLGAGLGIHGLFAAQLGARKVYLVEPTAVIEVARMVAKDNGLGQVECLQTTAEELKIDTQVDVISSVFTGNFLLSEDLLPSLFYARDHFLVPGGQLIPDRARMEVVPVCARDYYQENVQAWAIYRKQCVLNGMPPIDYSRLGGFAANYMFYDTAETFAAEQLATPGTLMELDFETADKAECDHGLEITIEQGGTCHGWVGWFQIRLVDEWLSTDGQDSKTHWSQVFLPLGEPIEVNRGDVIAFHLKRPEGGEWTWDTSHQGKRQRQSTFLSEALKPADLLKKSEQYQPVLNDKGRAAQWLLGRLDGTVAVGLLAEELLAEFPSVFRNHNSALRFIFSLTGRLS
jgi:Arginine methyltransferase oligomerization subdomain/Methyltransferase domain